MTSTLQPHLKSLKLDKPGADEIEVAIFGNGFGECIVVHVGRDQWFVVDSCIFKGSSRAAALEYFEAIGVDPSNAVEFVLATHWDDDHIMGISELVEECKGAKFFMSAAIKDTKFSRAFLHSPIARAVRTGQRARAGIAEFHKIYNYLDSNDLPRNYAVQDTTLMRKGPIEVTALSPHSSAFEKAVNSLAASFANPGGLPLASVRAQRPNHTSVVLWVKIGAVKLLLGADLEEAHDHKGWSMILKESVTRGDDAGVYKVAHHGSPTGHHDEVWTKMLAAKPISVIAPWERGGKFLPANDDIVRIRALSGSLHLVRPPGGALSSIKDLDAHTRAAFANCNARSILPSFNMVRLRSAGDSGIWTSKHFGEAVEIPCP